MRSGWQVGSIFGIPVRVDPSWLLILILFTLMYGSVWQDESWGSRWAWLAGFCMTLLLFASVLLHELGHSLVARLQGIHVTAITLFLFGGIASIDQESKTPGQAFQVAIAGPAVSFGLFIALFLISFLPLPAPAVTVVNNLASINFVLALFNMLPGLPLDGGQVLKAAIWKVTGSRLQGVRWAARLGQTFGWLAIVLGTTAVLATFRFSALWLVLLGWFGVRNADAYSRVTDLQEALLQLTAADAMTREFRVVDANLSLRQFADEYLLQDEQPKIYFAASGGRYSGLAAAEALREIERSRWEVETVQSLVQPLDAIASVAETTPLTQAIDRLEAEQLRRLVVLTPAGAVAGLLDRGDIVRALADKLNLALPEDILRQIKEEGVYPPELPLPAIVQNLGK